MTRVGAMVTATTTLMAACADPQPPADPASWQWQAKLGQTVTVEGVAEPRKLGAYVAVQPEGLWIDGLQDWPADAAGKRVRVTGRVIERADLPVFVQPPPGAPIAQGIPVPAGTDLERAAHRFLLAGATWKVIE